MHRKGIAMFERQHEDKISRRIARLIAKAERDGYDDDPEFLDLIERLYQKRSELLTGLDRGGISAPPGYLSTVPN